MEIKRDLYLKKLIDRQHNGMIKVITGMRRCGKSYLVFNIFQDYLKSQGVDDLHFIKVNLENRRNKKLRNPDNLLEVYVLVSMGTLAERCKNKGQRLKGRSRKM